MNVDSTLGYLVMPNLSLYNISKHGRQKLSFEIVDSVAKQQRSCAGLDPNRRS